MSGTTYIRAPQVEELVEKLVPEHHDHLARHDVVFRNPPAKSRGKVVLGKARKISGLNAHLVGLDQRDDLGDLPVDFFVIEISYDHWQHLTDAQRLALVDHEYRRAGSRPRTGRHDRHRAGRDRPVLPAGAGPTLAGGATAR